MDSAHSAVHNKTELHNGPNDHTWRLNFDTLVYMMNEFDMRQKDLVALMSMCHSLRRAGVRALLDRHAGSIQPFLSPACLSSFCAFMEADFPSRCAHLRRRLDLTIFRPIDAYNPGDLNSFTRIVVNSPNITCLILDSVLYVRLATLNPEFHRSFHSRSSLQSLWITMDENSTPDMITYLREWSVPALSDYEIMGEPINWQLIEPFYSTISSLHLQGLALDFSQWRPCEHVTHLILQDLPWFALPDHLPCLFPNLESLDIFDTDWSEDDAMTGVIPDHIVQDLREKHTRNLRNVQNSTVTTWSHLQTIRADLHVIYGLALTCSVDQLVIEPQFSLESARHFLVDSIRSMRATKSITFEIQVPELTINTLMELRQVFVDCDFTKTECLKPEISFIHVNHTRVHSFVVNMMFEVMQYFQRTSSSQDSRVWAWMWRQNDEDLRYQFVCKRVRDASEFEEEWGDDWSDIIFSAPLPSDIPSS
ncbi:hypothetical protein K474DRAFT_1701707 [Panus rudis PR-1116 ss-1]|nr:hypothetical protein K474DRAFT_1701707 [Panus rudis PR-1116 ss-1]